MKSGFKPPAYTEDEKAEWKKKSDDYYLFFADLINMKHDGIVYGKRVVNEQPIHYDLLFTCEDMKKIVNEP